MKVFLLRRQKIALLAVLSIMVGFAGNFATLDYQLAEKIKNADMTALNGKTIVIDPGHGGIDSGAKYQNIKEKDINLALALKLGTILRSAGANVIFTRDSDIDYYSKGSGGKRNDLLKRVEIINNSGAALFISIHVNAISGSQWSGAEVYYNPKMPNNRELAETIQVVLKAFPPGNKRTAKKDSKILVLKDTVISGVLIEAGFLSNPREAAMLADDAYQQKMAEQIALAVAYHLHCNVAR